MKEVVVKVLNPTYSKDFIGVVTKSDDDSIINKKIFLPYVIPGEIVKAKITKDSKTFLRGEPLEILEVSPFRVEPKCPLFYQCGGCHFQHIEYSEQLRLKKKVVSDYLKIHGKVSLDFDINVLGEGKLLPFNYRKRALIHILENGKMGFFRNETHDVVSFDECQILSKKLNESFKELKPEISKYGKYFYSLVLDDDVENIFAILNIREEYQVKELREKNFFDIYKKFPYKFIFEYRGKEIFKNFEFEESAGHFSQVNIEANKYLVNFVKDESFKRGPFNSVTELYAGSGNFTFMLSSISKKITAVELDGKLVKRGENISKEKNLGDKILFIQSSCEKFVKKNKLGNLVLLDPPRGGAKEVVKYINPKDTSIVIYISCALPTFERDLKELLSKGYKISSFSILDMFPNTYHVETVGGLEII